MPQVRELVVLHSCRMSRMRMESRSGQLKRFGERPVIVAQNFHPQQSGQTTCIGGYLRWDECLGIGDGRRDSDEENDAASSFKTYSCRHFQATLKAAMEYGILALFMFIQHGYSFCYCFASRFC